MNYSSFNKKNLRPTRNRFSFQKILGSIKVKKNRKIAPIITTKAAFRAPNRVPGFAMKEIKKIIKRVSYILIFLVFVIFLIWLLFSSKAFKIKNITINSDSSKYIEPLTKLVNIKIQKQGNIFLFNNDSLVELINKESGSFFYDIKIEKDFPNSIIVNLKERSPRVVFITDKYKFYFDENAKMILKSSTSKTSKPETLKQTTSPQVEVKTNTEAETIKTEKNTEEKEIDIMQELLNNKTDKVDTIEKESKNITNNVDNTKEEAYNLFDFSNKEDIFKGYKFPEVHTGQANLDLKDGDINKDKISFITKLYTKLPTQSINISKISLDVINDSKLTVKTEVGYEIYFNMDDDIEQQIAYLNAIIKNKIKDDIKKIQYIDLRFGSKIYYK